MIRNDIQLARTEARVRQLENEIFELENQYQGIELDFWSRQFRAELIDLQKEISEYRQLKEISFEDAVTNLMQEPILLENIGELLTKLRIASKNTQRDLATRLGWRQSNLSRFENENYSSQTIGKISDFVGLLGIQLLVRPKLNIDQVEDLTYAESDQQYLQLFNFPSNLVTEQNYIEEPEHSAQVMLPIGG